MTTRTIIFDLDGTLLDTLEDLAAAVDHALALRGLPPHTLEEYRTMVGHGVRNLVRQALGPAPDDAVVDAALADFKAHYTAHIDERTRPYPGIPELLRTLHARGFALAIASNKFQEGTARLAARFFPGIPFAVILGNRPGFPLKPDPEIIGEVLRRTGSAPADAVMVGDSRTDMLTAANGGIRGIAVNWGYRTLAPSDAYTLVDSVAGLERALLTERHPFQPFLPEGARILFLGSFPPGAHRWSMPFYYPNFQNDFWRILGLIFFQDPAHFILPGQKRFDEGAIRAFCRAQGLAFYDTATEVVRLKDNASDAFLEVVTPTDIPALLARIPACRDIVVTGEKAARTLATTLGCPPPPVGGSVEVTLGSGHVGITSRALTLWRMPSTSRAYPLPLEKKAKEYQKVLKGRI